MAFSDYLNHEEWAEIYKKLIFWELEMSSAGNTEMGEVLEMQKNEANLNFSKYVVENYEELSKIFPRNYDGILTPELCEKGASILRTIKEHEEEAIYFLKRAKKNWKKK